jgi:hypothetical protein
MRLETTRISLAVHSNGTMLVSATGDFYSVQY